MINPKELRIGNCVRLYLNHSDYSEFHIELADLNLIVNKGGDYFPIPLTPEILEKCGFYETFENSGIGHWQNKICIGIHKGDYHLLLGTEFMQPNVIIRYLHQLQNLYFALTGEELEIKELQHA